MTRSLMEFLSQSRTRSLRTCRSKWKTTKNRDKSLAMLIITLVVFASLGGSTAQSYVDGVQPKTAQVEDTDRAAQLIRRSEALPDVRRLDADNAARAALLVETSDVP